MLIVASGPVTGGFLKGKGARFQLFGDTMTTVNLMLSTGTSDRIHMSEAAATLLIKAGKKKWVSMREDRVHSPEKGEMRTYYLVKGNRQGNVAIDDSSFNDDDSDSMDADGLQDLHCQERWIEWNVDIFKRLLKQIIAGRPRGPFVSSNSLTGAATPLVSTETRMPLDEVQEIIHLPVFDKRAAQRRHDNQDVEVPDFVVAELKEYVTEMGTWRLFWLLSSK
jgi:Adenylate and Guanylate cyclase catalytic domain